MTDLLTIGYEGCTSADVLGELRRAGHPERMEAIFREHMTSDRAQAELAQARQLVQERRACLLCFERNPMMCHRRLVAEMIVAGTAQPIVHLHAGV